MHCSARPISIETENIQSLHTHKKKKKIYFKSFLSTFFYLNLQSPLNSMLRLLARSPLTSSVFSTPGTGYSPDDFNLPANASDERIEIIFFFLSERKSSDNRAAVRVLARK